MLCVEPALRHSNVSLLTDAYMERLETSASGREVTGVVVKRGDVTERYAADGRDNMCDGCPDMTVHDGKLVWSCRLEEWREFGQPLRAVPVANPPSAPAA